MALAQALVDNGVVIAQTGTTSEESQRCTRGVAKIGDPHNALLLEWPGMLGS